MLQRCLSIHAHFYQPPREDPLTGYIPNEIGATPFQNWNERINSECYRPNAELRNFEQISFNFGPTLSTWMESHDQATYRKIIEQDRINVQRYGVGNAMAQAYNHTILPLDSYLDKVTQIKWGIADFENRFGRRPQGMWLPETAVDQETLEILARQGITLTILAPWQADPESSDTSEPSWVKLPSGNQICVFFYERELSGRLSFDPGVTINADAFAQNILQPHFSPGKLKSGEPELILVATDGELYGHHQHLRDRFLARLMDGASSRLGIQPIYPGLWLKSHPPRQTARIVDRTSWSCHHGIARWTGGCACTPGDRTWKVKLRQAFGDLAGELDRAYLDVTAPLIQDPWLLRDRYIHVILGEMSLEQLLAEMDGPKLTSEQTNRVKLVLESQRERLRMYTSCGWYHDDFDRIEPKNNVAYATQAAYLAYLATGVKSWPAIMPELRQVVSRRTRLSAANVFERHLRRAEQAKAPD